MAYPDEIREKALELFSGCSSEKAVEQLRRYLYDQNDKLGFNKYTENDVPNPRTVRTWRRNKASFYSIVEDMDARKNDEKENSSYRTPISSFI